MMLTRTKPSPPEKRRRSKRPGGVRTAIAAAALLFAFGCAEEGGSTAAETGEPNGAVMAEAAAETARTVVPADAETIRLSFAPLVREVAPAVVSITARRVSAPSRRVDPFFDDPFFRHFFGDLPFGRPRRESREQSSLGSGVIVAEDGLIVTNYHVIDGADEITVVLADRTEHRADIVASDERSDLAFLRIDPGQELATVELGDSDRIEVGDLVLAIGNPFGIGQTVTSGIVSARARATPGARSDVSFIQTDAAINPGNSGGALVSMDGELIGVNTAIFTRGGGSIGIGFAIPANLVAARIIGIEQGLETARPWLGAALKPIDTTLAEALDLDRPQGVLIERVHPESVAAEAGMRAGDVIQSVDGVEVVDVPGLNLRLQLEPLGSRVPVTVIRRDQTVELALPLEPPPGDPDPALHRLAGNHPLSGAVVAELSPAFNETLDIDLFAEGVGIVEVEPRSFATRLQLQPGDVVTAINGEQVSSVDALERLLAVRRQRWVISIERGGRTFDLTIA